MSGSSDLIIKDYMTPVPHGIEPHETLQKAKLRMLDLEIRHLPVRAGGKVVGMISMRDVEMLETFENIDLEHTEIGKMMTTEPYTVSESTPIKEAVREMVSNKYGSAVVTDSETKLIGIFTETDALKVLDKVL